MFLWKLLKQFEMRRFPKRIKEQRRMAAASEDAGEKKQLQITQENIRGFWEPNEYRQQSFIALKLYYDLAEQMFARFEKSKKNKFMPQPWCPMEYHFGNDVSLNEWINLYITRVWMGATNEIVVLFKNGSSVRKEWYY